MKTITRLLILCTVLMTLGVGVTTAQDDDICASLTEINYGDTVTGSIEGDLYIFGWCFDGAAGDEITVTLEATSGNLDTYVGLSDQTLQETYIENDDVDESTTNSGFTFTLPESATYVLIASRFELETGTTTGDFEMTLTSASSGVKGQDTTEAEPDFPVVGNGVRGNQAVEIFIDCDTGERVQAGVQFSFINVNPGFPYTVTAIGLEGFDPVLAVETRPGIGECNDDDPDVEGSTIPIPGGALVEASRRSSQIRFTTPQRGFPTNITVGSFNESGGDFVLIIEGFRIDPRDELDGFSIRVPSSVATEPLGVYVIAADTSLDAIMGVGAGDGLSQAYSGNDFEPDDVDYDNISYPLLFCDNIGVETCDFTPELVQQAFSIKGGGNYVYGPTDAGLVLIPNMTDPLLYAFGSSSSETVGDYAILVYGTVPGN